MKPVDVSNLKVALVHDQLCEFGGAERVLETLKKIYPAADIYTSVYRPEMLGSHSKQFKEWNVITSWFDKIPFIRNYYSPFRFLTPYIWEQFDFKKYDLVISSSGSWMSHGVLTRLETIHVCYMHHPPRYLYGYETAIEWQKYMIIRIYAAIVNHSLRMWDYLSAQRVDHYIANSEETKSRIKKIYRRDSTVIYPPVQIPSDISHPHDGDYYVTTARLSRAKHVDILIKAANNYGFELKIIGSGREFDMLKAIAGPTVTFLSHIKDEKFAELYSNAKAFLFASVDEEFGIAPVEAMGYGLPVISYASGGLKEIVRHGTNGFLYEKLDPVALIEAMKEFEKRDEKDKKKMRIAARKTAESFSEEIFTSHIKELCNQLLSCQKK